MEDEYKVAVKWNINPFTFDEKAVSVIKSADFVKKEEENEKETP